MENLLLMGIDTRPMVNSALKLDYKTFSISYFKTVDFKVPYAEKHVLDQESVISCGRFEENYSPEKLLELSKDFLFQNHDGDEIDKIVLTTGINAQNFSTKIKQDGLMTKVVKYDETGITVRIGQENEIKALQDCTVITVPYESSSGERGAISVFGPTRMEYNKIIPLLEYIAKNIKNIV